MLLDLAMNARCPFTRVCPAGWALRFGKQSVDKLKRRGSNFYRISFNIAQYLLFLRVLLQN